MNFLIYALDVINSETARIIFFFCDLANLVPIYMSATPQNYWFMGKL